jgi:hypothetical protein
MQARRWFIGGEVVDVDVPGARELPDSVAVGVLAVDGLELELSSGTGAALEFFLAATDSALTWEYELRSGVPLRCGRYGGDGGGGYVFAVAPGAGEVFGWAAPSYSPERLAVHLNHVRIEDRSGHPVVTPGGPVRWSDTRPPSVAQQVNLSAANGYLLDIRQARPVGASTRSRGAQVRGGYLSRSGPQQNRPHVVLESDRFVAYGLPTPGTPLDEVVESMADLTTT